MSIPVKSIEGEDVSQDVDERTPSHSLSARPLPAERSAQRSRRSSASTEEHERERKRAMEERVKALTTKLIDRLRPLSSKRPGDKDDVETLAFQDRIKREADDLKARELRC